MIESESIRGAAVSLVVSTSFRNCVLLAFNGLRLSTVLGKELPDGLDPDTVIRMYVSDEVCSVLEACVC